MPIKLLFYALLLTGTALEIVADFIFKHWAEGEGRPGLLWAGLVVYLAGAALWACSLRYAPLAKAGMVFAVANILLLTLGGAVIFGERLTATHLVGMALGVLGLAVLETAG